MEGILTDLKEALKLPNELYIADSFAMTFDENGEISKADTFLYGKDEKGVTRTYLVTYDKEKSDKITVWTDGEANPDYKSDMQLSPMLEILKMADYRERVAEWSSLYGSQQYEILYYGRRHFPTAQGLVIVNGDESALSRMQDGGKVLGFEVSLHMPDKEEVTPVRYMMNPEYISQDVINAAAGSRYYQLEHTTDGELLIQIRFREMEVQHKV